VSTYEDNDELSWDELEIELAGEGITRGDVKKYKNEIREYLRMLIVGTNSSVDETELRVELSDSISLPGGVDEPRFFDHNQDLQINQAIKRARRVRRWKTLGLGGW